nr:hypothetical protein SHINE37_41450 [Rhizobiaceae bacterium]
MDPRVKPEDDGGEETPPALQAARHAAPAFSDEFPLLASFSGIIRGWRRGGSGASPSHGAARSPFADTSKPLVLRHPRA